MNEERITSRQNPLLRHVRQLLRSGDCRRESGAYIGDGLKLLDEALRWGAPLQTVIAANGVTLPPLPDGVRVVRIPPDVMESVSLMKTPQGVLFTCALPETAPLSFPNGALILDGIQDPGNLGTILRTADALETPVVLCEGCADPWSPKVVRASMGAVFRTVPQRAGAEETAAYCETNHIKLFAASLTTGAADLRTVDLNGAAVVIGSEGQGVGPALLTRSNGQLIIPMNPRCESLNAAVAAAIILWQMRVSRD